MQARAIQGPWAAGERILVCISEDPRAAGLVRYTKRLADRLHAPWTALYVEGRRSLQLSEEQRDRVADTLRLAAALDGEAITVPGGDRRIADDVLAYAHANNITHIVIGKSTRSRWFEMLHGSVVHDLVRRSGNISVHVIAGDELAGEPIPQKTVRTAEAAQSLDPRSYLAALIAVAVALGVGLAIQPWLGIENVDLVFLTAIVAVAVRFGLWPSLLASVAASLCYNFFFLPPIYTFTITDPTNVTAFIFFIVMAVLVSNVAARVRTQAVAAMARARTTEVALFLQPQARRRRHARRRAVGDRLPDRADAQGARRAAAAGERHRSRCAPDIRRRTCSTMPISPPPNGPGRTTGRPGAAPIRCPAPSGCSCRCAPAAARSAWSASTATSRGRC